MMTNFSIIIENCRDGTSLSLRKKKGYLEFFGCYISSLLVSTWRRLGLTTVTVLWTYIPHPLYGVGSIDVGTSVIGYHLWLHGASDERCSQAFDRNPNGRFIYVLVKNVGAGVLKIPIFVPTF
jgi:hypothetical protein